MYVGDVDLKATYCIPSDDVEKAFVIGKNYKTLEYTAKYFDREWLIETTARQVDKRLWNKTTAWIVARLAGKTAEYLGGDFDMAFVYMFKRYHQAIGYEFDIMDGNELYKILQEQQI